MPIILPYGWWWIFPVFGIAAMLVFRWVMGSQSPRHRHSVSFGPECGPRPGKRVEEAGKQWPHDPGAIQLERLQCRCRRDIPSLHEPWKGRSQGRERIRSSCPL